MNLPKTVPAAWIKAAKVGDSVMTKLKELQAAYEAATKGEWATEKGGTAYYPLQIRSNTEDWDHFIVAFHSWESHREDNAKFIALAHNMMPTLLEAIDLLETVSSARACQDHEFDVDAWFKQVRSLLGDLK